MLERPSMKYLPLLLSLLPYSCLLLPLLLLPLPLLLQNQLLPSSLLLLLSPSLLRKSKNHSPCLDPNNLLLLTLFLPLLLNLLPLLRPQRRISQRKSPFPSLFRRNPRKDFHSLERSLLLPLPLLLLLWLQILPLRTQLLLLHLRNPKTSSAFLERNQAALSPMPPPPRNLLHLPLLLLLL